jgi:hypothetical protein
LGFFLLIYYWSWIKKQSSDGIIWSSTISISHKKNAGRKYYASHPMFEHIYEQAVAGTGNSASKRGKCTLWVGIISKVKKKKKKKRAGYTVHQRQTPFKNPEVRGKCPPLPILLLFLLDL